MILDKLKSYIEKLSRDEKNSYVYRALSSFEMLENTDLMIKRYKDQPQTEKGAILLDVFGILQGLFVAIDALYDLAIGLTRYKYHVNINSNPVLHELKYIRNDIVGHPTHRIYQDGGTGFSRLKTDHISKEKIVYETYIYSKNQVEVKEKIVNFKEILKQYQKEKDIVLNNIYQYLLKIDTKTNIPEKLFTLYENLNEETLTKIEALFKETYRVEQDFKHRFFWRAGLLRILLFWHEEDSNLNRLILYMSKTQVSKMYEIALDLEERTGEELFTALPSILNQFYKFIRKNEEDAYKLLTNIHDLDHPLHQSDLVALMSLNPPRDVYQLLQFLKDQTSEEKVYLIGSALRAYRLKKIRTIQDNVL